MVLEDSLEKLRESPLSFFCQSFPTLLKFFDFLLHRWSSESVDYFRRVYLDPIVDRVELLRFSNSQFDQKPAKPKGERETSREEAGETYSSSPTLTNSRFGFLKIFLTDANSCKISNSTDWRQSRASWTRNEETLSTLIVEKKFGCTHAEILEAIRIFPEILL